MNSQRILKIAKKVLKVESQAINQLINKLSDDFEKSIKAILKCRGRIIILGMGKSGIIGKKIAATMSSTGTPSYFVHPAEAIHGDLGMITNNDIIILISNSGQSDELNNIIQYTSRNKNIKLIGITSKRDSVLYKNCDIGFLMPSIKEAGPENIVPTSSTSAQLALGDAIAISCMRYKKFTKLDFKKIHPSGTLSVRLKTVSDLMITGKKLPVVSQDIKMKKALDIINKKKLGVLIIRDRNFKTKGIITDGDLKRIAQKYSDFEKLKLSRVMKKNPITVDKDTLAASALSIMNSKKITALCVHKNKNLKKTIGLIHMHDILSSNIN